MNKTICLRIKPEVHLMLEELRLELMRSAKTYSTISKADLISILVSNAYQAASEKKNKSSEST